MDMMKLGGFICECRKRLGITQKDLGDALGITDKAVSKWERGISCPDIELIGPLSTILKCGVDELLAGCLHDNKESSQRPFEPAETPKLDTEKLSETLKVNYSFNSQMSVSPFLFGDNLEHTRSSVCAGISAQMLKNRKFAGRPSVEGVANCWKPVGDAYFRFYERDRAYTKHHEDYHMRRRNERNAQAVISYKDTGTYGISQNEIYFEKGREYEFRIVASAVGQIDIKATVTGDGKALEIFKEKAKGPYTSYAAVFTSAFTGNGELAVTFDGFGSLLIGAVSLMPADNFHGMRRDVIEEFKKISPRILRWPGGNFSGEYNWKDGLLPADERSPFESYLGMETQPHTYCYDFHEINTDDFIALCKELGCEPFITVNPAWDTPDSSREWVEYCNGDETTEYGRLRIERGHKEPYNVRFWSLGNEFGYGHMEGENDAVGYINAVMPHAIEMLKSSPNLVLCQSGPYPNQEWSSCTAKVLKSAAPIVSLHNYVNMPEYIYPENFEKDYYSLISGVKINLAKMELMRSQLNDKSIKISFDEWNVWWAWYRKGSVSEGIFSAYSLHSFIINADRLGVVMACHFESVNEGGIRVTGAGVELTPTGTALAVMSGHAGGVLLFGNDECVATYKNGIITVTLINLSYDKEKKFILPDGKCLSADLYSSESVLPNSVFEKTDLTASLKTDNIVLPPHSMMKLTFEK